MLNKKGLIRIISIALGAIVIVTSMPVCSFAKGLPSAGIDFVLGDGTSVKTIKDETKATPSPSATPLAVSAEERSRTAPPTQTPTAVPDDGHFSTSGPGNSESSAEIESESPSPTPAEEIADDDGIEETTVSTLEDKSLAEKDRELEAKREEEHFKNLVIAQVTNYVNVRGDASEEAEIVGKLYDKSVGELLSEKDGWYEIESGSCRGYVKAEFCVTGDAAVELAKKVGTRVCTVDTTTLKVREEPSTEATVLGLIPNGEILTVSEELDGWVKVNIEEGDGYVSLDYVKLSTEFVKAESKAEEEARKAKEEAARLAAIEAANKANKKNKGSSSGGKQTIYATGGGSELGRQVANYGLQFVGNPYVYGGSSLTNGTDCSGFVMSVYKNFGVSLPHSSSADRSVGYAVDGLANAQPGDLVCYSGHVGLYIGGGQIVHASSKKTGIKVSNADYRQILAIRRIF